jgi:hypothetical protein
MKKNILTDGVVEYELDSWKDFFALTNDEFAQAPAFVYRGQGYCDWPLISSLDRPTMRYSNKKNLNGGNPENFECPPFSDEEHLAAFKRAIRGRRGPNPPPLDDEEYWALGQHHGLKTRRLDFTRSPYVALFFAFEEEHVLVGNQLIVPEFRGVYAWSTSTVDHPDNEPAVQVKVMSPKSDANFRLVSQGGLLAHIPKDVDVEGYVRSCFKGDDRRANYSKVKIPNSDRDGCLIALNKMNLNHVTLIPDIDGAARHVNSLWQPGHDDAIAYV